MTDPDLERADLDARELLRLDIQEAEMRLAGMRLQLESLEGPPGDQTKLPPESASHTAWRLAETYGFALVEIATEVERLPQPCRTYWIRAWRGARDDEPTFIAEGSTIAAAEDSLGKQCGYR